LSVGIDPADESPFIPPKGGTDKHPNDLGFLRIIYGRDHDHDLWPGAMLTRSMSMPKSDQLHLPYEPSELASEQRWFLAQRAAHPLPLA